MKLQDYIHYYIGCKCQTPDGIGELVGVPWHVQQRDRVSIHFGNIVKTEHSIDKAIGRLRNHGDYLLQAQRMEPVGTIGITEDGFDLPGGVKPILRRLADLTRAEMKVVWHLTVGRPFPDSGNILWFDKETTTSCVPAKGPYGYPGSVTKVTGDTVPEWMHISMRPKGFVIAMMALSVRDHGYCVAHLDCAGKPFPIHYRVGWCEGKEALYNQLVKERRVK